MRCIAKRDFVQPREGIPDVRWSRVGMSESTTRWLGKDGLTLGCRPSKMSVHSQRVTHGTQRGSREVRDVEALRHHDQRGRHGDAADGAWRRLLLGSVSSKLLRLAHCAVLI